MSLTTKILFRENLDIQTNHLCGWFNKLLDQPHLNL